MKKGFIYIFCLLFLPAFSFAQVSSAAVASNARDRVFRNPPEQDYRRYQLKIVSSKLLVKDRHVYKLGLQPTFFHGDRYTAPRFDDCSPKEIIVNARYDYDSEFTYENIQFTKCSAIKKSNQVTANLHIHKNVLRYEIVGSGVDAWEMMLNEIFLGLKVYADGDKLIAKLNNQLVCKLPASSVISNEKPIQCKEGKPPYTLSAKPINGDYNNTYYFMLKKNDQPDFLETAIAHW